MKYLKGVGVVAALLLISACFLPWYHISWRALTISGIEAGDKLGKPGYWHFVFAFCYLVFTLIPKIWAKQWNVFIAAINMAWMIRNFFALAACSGGECPERQWGIWLLLISSVLMLLAALFPGLKVPVKTDNRIP
jgi:hypothetical protein